jgi:hypothetical protein
MRSLAALLILGSVAGSLPAQADVERRLADLELRLTHAQSAARPVIGPAVGAVIGAAIAGIVNYLIFVRIAAQQKRKELCVQLHSRWLSTEMWHIRQVTWQELAMAPRSGEKIDLAQIQQEKPAVYEQLGAICKFIESVNVLLSGPNLINARLARRLFWDDFKAWLDCLDAATFPQPRQQHYDAHVRAARKTFEAITCSKKSWPASYDDCRYAASALDN